MSDMSALSIGLSGLDASQEGLNAVGQNITNAGTPGYVDEEVSLESVGTGAGPGAISLYGGGVQVAGLDRLSDLPLQSQMLAGQSGDGALAARQSGMAGIQQLFPEPTGTGSISTALSGYWTAWGNLQKNGADSSARQQLLDAGSTLAGALNAASAGITQVAETARDQLAPTVTAINGLTSQIAALNQSIVASGAAGRVNGHLEDQRDALVSQLSNQIGVRVSLQADGSETISAGTGSLVVGSTSQALQVSGSGSATSITWQSGSGPVAVSGGTLGGLLQTVDTDVPTYTAALDTVASTLIHSVNQAQAQGIDLTGAAGKPFFSGTGAADISVALANPDGIAAASASTPVPPVPAHNTDGSNAAAIAELATATGGPDATYASFVGGLGNDVAQLKTQLGAQSQVTSTATAAYRSQTGVDTNQELTEMVQYQNAYSAAAKYISTVDQTMQSLLAAIG